MTLLPPVTDRRQRRTRKAVQAAFLELIAEVPFEELTVDEIASRADVARATFYAHYHDKNVLLLATTVDLAAELTARVAEAAPRQGEPYNGRALSALFRHGAEHAVLYRLVLSGAGAGLPRAALGRLLRRYVDGLFVELRAGLPGSPAVDLSLVAASLVAAVLGVLEAWLAGDVLGEPDTLGRDLIRTQVAGIEWALQLPAGAMPFQDVADTAGAG